MLIAIVLSELPSRDPPDRLEPQWSDLEVRRDCEFEVRRHMQALVVAERNRHYRQVVVVGRRVVDMHCKQVVVKRLLVGAQTPQTHQRTRMEARDLHCRQA